MLLYTVKNKLGEAFDLDGQPGFRQRARRRGGEHQDFYRFARVGTTDRR